MLPTILHVVTAISAGYAVGSEFSSRSRRAWLATAGGSPLAALVGKLAPLFGIFVLMMVVGSGIVHGLYAVPFRGDAIMMGAAACLLLIAYLALGALFQLLVRNLALGLSLTGIFCSPAFGFAGVGFPILAMNGFAQFWGDLMPLRWYIQILFDQAVRGLPTSVSLRRSPCSAASPSGSPPSPGCGCGRSRTPSKRIMRPRRRRPSRSRLEQASAPRWQRNCASSSATRACSD